VSDEAQRNGGEDPLDGTDEDSEDAPMRSRVRSWIARGIPRERAFWAALPVAFALMTLLAYVDGIGLWKRIYSGGWMLNPVFWWPYFLTGNQYTVSCIWTGGFHCWLVSLPLEYLLSAIWWLVPSTAIARLAARAWYRRARVLAWMKDNSALLATFIAVLWIVSALAHAPGIGYTSGYCPFPCVWCRGISLVSLNWVFWWPLFVFGLDSFCGRGPLDFPQLYVASFLWWLLLSWFLARLTLPGLREFREKPPFGLRRRRRFPPRQKV